jgi:hypothetical protein
MEQFRMMLLDLRRQLCGASLRLAVALQCAALLPALDPAYGTALNRYMQRFETFQAIASPGFMDFEQAQRMVDPGGALQSYCVVAAACYDQYIAGLLATCLVLRHICYLACVV